MTVTFNTAANAYKQQNKMLEGINPAEGGTEAAQGGNFSDFLKEGLQGAVQTLEKSDALSAQAMTGKVEISELVTAITNAELTLNTVVAVRDRVISAYQEILRMPI